MSALAFEVIPRELQLEINNVFECANLCVKEHFTFLDEIIDVAKEQLSLPGLNLLPKTPSEKKPQRRRGRAVRKNLNLEKIDESDDVNKETDDDDLHRISKQVSPTSAIKKRSGSSSIWHAVRNNLNLEKIDESDDVNKKTDDDNLHRISKQVSPTSAIKKRSGSSSVRCAVQKNLNMEKIDKPDDLNKKTDNDDLHRISKHISPTSAVKTRSGNSSVRLEVQKNLNLEKIDEPDYLNKKADEDGLHRISKHIARTSAINKRRSSVQSKQKLVKAVELVANDIEEVSTTTSMMTRSKFRQKLKNIHSAVKATPTILKPIVSRGRTASPHKHPAGLSNTASKAISFSALKSSHVLSNSTQAINRPGSLLNALYKPRPTPLNLNSSAQTFIRKQTPQKNSQAEREKERREKLLRMQEQRQAEAEANKQEIIKQKIETQKRKREEREKKVALHREQQLQQDALRKQLDNKLFPNYSANPLPTSTVKKLDKLPSKTKLKSPVKQSQASPPLANKQKTLPKTAFFSKSVASASNMETNNETISVQQVHTVLNENYDISDLCSDDDTDEEDNPRKRIPGWAQGAALKAFLVQQYYKPEVEPEDLFGCIHIPDLAILFKMKRKRYELRTSSALWDSPI